MNNTMISPAYAGFYHLPLVWCTETPTLEMWRGSPIEEILKIVYEGTLQNGIRFRVRRDGFIWFDCNKWEPGTFTEIPGWDCVPGTKVPKEVVSAKKVAEVRAYNRTMLINAYQLCLNSSHGIKRSRATAIGVPVQSRSVVALTDFTNPISLLYGPDFHDPYGCFVNSSLQKIANRDEIALRSRRLLEHDVITDSFEKLDEVLRVENKDALKIVELLFWAHNHYSESSFADSLILSWAACEKIINSLWLKFLDLKKQNLGLRQRINKDRKKKLVGRDFTASIMTEVLELADVINYELFERLDETRKKRNAWLHSLDGIYDTDASKALRAASELFGVSTGITLRPSISRTVPGTGGVLPELYEFPSS